MQAILLKEVEGLGEPGTVVTVARGYMRNFLLPRGIAEEATPARIAEVRRREDARRAAELKAKAGDDGRLFGSITSADVATAIEEARGVKLDRRHITVEPPIRAVGTYSVPVDLGPGLQTEVKTIVSPLLD